MDDFEAVIVAGEEDFFDDEGLIAEGVDRYGVQHLYSNDYDFEEVGKREQQQGFVTDVLSNLIADVFTAGIDNLDVSHEEGNSSSSTKPSLPAKSFISLVEKGHFHLRLAGEAHRNFKSNRALLRYVDALALFSMAIKVGSKLGVDSCILDGLDTLANMCRTNQEGLKAILDEQRMLGATDQDGDKDEDEDEEKDKDEVSIRFSICAYFRECSIFLRFVPNLQRGKEKYGRNLGCDITLAVITSFCSIYTCIRSQMPAKLCWRMCMGLRLPIPAC